MISEMEVEAMEAMDYDQLINNIDKARDKDPLATRILHRLDSPNCPEGWELVNRTLKFWNWHHAPDQGTLQLQVIHNHHDHPSTGHFGETRTMDLVCQEFHWPGLWKTVADYVKSCTSCAQAKAPWHKLYRKLKQLPIPAHLWSSISMAFIEHLPKSSGHSAILVIMDTLTKQAIFVPPHD